MTSLLSPLASLVLPSAWEPTVQEGQWAPTHLTIAHWKSAIPLTGLGGICYKLFVPQEPGGHLGPCADMPQINSY